MKLLFFVLLSLLCSAGQAQLLNDSTLQFVSYWDLDEQHEYHVSQTKQKIIAGDTLLLSHVEYDSDLQVIDATDSTQTMMWHYKNYQYDQNDSVMNALMSIADNLSVVYGTNEMGVFEHVENSLEIQEFIYQGLDSMRQFMRQVPNADAVINQIRTMFSGRQAIESTAIEEILLFHKALGSQFELGQRYSGDTKLANNFGGEPFDALIESQIYDLDTVNQTAVVQIITTVDSRQATEAVYQYLNRMAQTMGQPALKREEVPELTIQHRYAANIHLPSGWPLYIINVKDVKAEGQQQLETVEINFME